MIGCSSTAHGAASLGQGEVTLWLITAWLPPGTRQVLAELHSGLDEGIAKTRLTARLTLLCGNVSAGHWLPGGHGQMRRGTMGLSAVLSEALCKLLMQHGDLEAFSPWWPRWASLWHFISLRFPVHALRCKLHCFLP